MIRRLRAAPPLLAAAALLLGAPLAGGAQIPTPAQHFGFELGSHRQLADWDELTAFYEKLAEGSSRVILDTLGTTTMGRPMVMLTITSADNQARIDELQEIQLRLTDPRTVQGSGELEGLLDRGRAVVLITHGIHATEVGSGQVAGRLAWRLATSDDPRIRRILDEVILLHVPSLNPDGLQWVVDWYDRWKGTEHEAAPLPWLYHFYVGHDNNRDWYAFTQDETIHTIRDAHNAWHPHIVHDIHQMGGSGARIFFPPYIDPWEPNIDPALTSAVNQLGTWMAAVLTKEGKPGVVVNGQYDAYTPARAYQHYHAGARILSETASARMATPVTVDPVDLLGDRRNYDSGTRSWNFPDPWEGGEWGLPDIVDYMESGALALLENAAKNRRYWLENQHAIVRRAVEGEAGLAPAAWIIPAEQENDAGVAYLLRVLTMGDVEVHRATGAFTADGIRFPEGSWVVPMNQPWASFAQTMLEVQRYPDLRQYPGGPPQRPYDVTAHTLGYLTDVETVAVEEIPPVEVGPRVDVADFRFQLPEALSGDGAPRVAIYKGWQEPMEAGWTRWVFDEHGLAYDTLHNADVQGGDLAERWDVILLQAQDGASILEGYARGTVPPQYAGGIGARGAEALREFVRSGGRLVAVEQAADFVAELLELPVENGVADLSEIDFYIPGSILRLELDSESPLAQGMDAEGVAWFWRSSMAFEVTESSAVRVSARYGSGDPLLSGWMLGGEHVAGRPAVLEADVGEGSVVLFGFQPNYRAQSVATWPLLFNALTP